MDILIQLNLFGAYLFFQIYLSTDYIRLIGINVTNSKMLQILINFLIKFNYDYVDLKLFRN